MINNRLKYIFSCLALLAGVFSLAQTISTVTPFKAKPGEGLTVTITGSATFFTQSSGTTNKAWLNKDGHRINFYNLTPVTDTEIKMDLKVPCSADTGLWTFYYKETDPKLPYDTIVQSNSFYVYDKLNLAKAVSTVANCGQFNGSAYVNATGGTAPYFYSWSNGDVTSVASKLGKGSYTVTVTDANGCSIDTTLLIDISGGGEIKGDVLYGTQPIESGYILLLRYNMGIKMKVLDSLQLSVGGKFKFSNVDAGNYLLYVKPGAAYGLPDFYYGSTHRWDGAKIQLNSCDSANVSVNAFKLPAMAAGNATIKGKLLQGNGFNKGPGDPIPGLSIGLEIYPPGGQMTAQSITDSNGDFEFNDIPEGSYRIWVDIPGLPMDSSYYFTITSADSFVTNLIFFADSNSIYIDTTTTPQLIPKLITNAVQVYPNPFSEQTTIEYSVQTDSKVTIQLYNLLGEVIFVRTENKTKGVYKEIFNSKQFGKAEGVYILKVTIGNTEFLQRIVEVH